MQSITIAHIDNNLDLDHGEGSVTFSWLDAHGIRRSLTMDVEGHCSREMPIRSGTGASIASVLHNRVLLCFTEELAAKLELDRELALEGAVSEAVSRDLRRLAEGF